MTAPTRVVIEPGFTAPVHVPVLVIGAGACGLMPETTRKARQRCRAKYAGQCAADAIEAGTLRLPEPLPGACTRPGRAPCRRHSG